MLHLNEHGWRTELVGTLGFQHHVTEFQVHLLNCTCIKLNISARLIKRRLILKISKLELWSAPCRELNGVLPQRYFYLESVKVTLFGRRVFADVRILRRDHSGLSGRGINQMTGEKTRRGGKGHIKTEAEIVVVQPSAEVCLEPPKDGRGQGRCF